MPQHSTQNSLTVYGLFFLLTFCLFLSACTHFITGAPEKRLDLGETEARALLNQISRVNRTLQTFKGIGKVKISKRGAIQGGRVAWIGSNDGKLRIEVLGVSGQPIASLASDGSWVYMSSPKHRRFYKSRINDANLNNFISIPVKTSDVISLITGRIPIREYVSADVKESAPGDGYVLTLKKRWGNIAEKIYLDSRKEFVHKIEIFDVTGTFVYRAILEDVRMIQDYQIASRVKLSDDAGADFNLTIERYWPNVPISNNMFELVPPE